MCIDIVEIWLGIANGQILSNFDGYLPEIQCPLGEPLKPFNLLEIF